MKPLVIVGELNPYGEDPAFALYHLPRQASGDRLREHLGLSDAVYEPIPKTNLCTGKWDRLAATEAARRLLDRYAVVVALGVKVKRAFGLDESVGPFRARQLGAATILCLPHPSGRCITWLEPDSRARARQLLRQHAPWIAWGAPDENPCSPADAPR